MTDQTHFSTTEHALRHPVLWVVLTLWFAGVMTMAHAGLFLTDDVPFPLPVNLALAALLPPLVYLGAYRSFPALRAWVAQLDIAWVVGAQTWRVVGVVFLMLWGLGDLPAIFALTAGLGDIAVGVFALTVTLAVQQRAAGWETRVRWLVYVGLLDFVAAFGTAILSGQGFPLRLAGEPLPLVMQALPMSMIPTFGVPSFIILHIIAWQKLRDAR